MLHVVIKITHNHTVELDGLQSHIYPFHLLRSNRGYMLLKVHDSTICHYDNKDLHMMVLKIYPYQSGLGEVVN